MSKLENEMKFEIGEILFFKSATNNEIARPKRYLVVGRLLEECSGGKQVHYKLGNTSGWAAEIELTREKPPYEPICEEQLQDCGRVELAREVMRRERWEIFKAKHAPEETGPSNEELAS